MSRENLSIEFHPDLIELKKGELVNGNGSEFFIGKCYIQLEKVDFPFNGHFSRSF